uniref:Uncharacterized protein n=1 Tax=Palpitomonas bilix TaxID=652834 RepID=A0A7S3GK59_9EUKA
MKKKEESKKGREGEGGKVGEEKKGERGGGGKEGENGKSGVSKEGGGDEKEKQRRDEDGGEGEEGGEEKREGDCDRVKKGGKEGEDGKEGRKEERGKSEEPSMERREEQAGGGLEARKSGVKRGQSTGRNNEEKEEKEEKRKKVSYTLRTVCSTRIPSNPRTFTFSRSGEYLYVGYHNSLDAALKVYSFTSGQPLTEVGTKYGHLRDIASVTANDEDTVILTGSVDLTGRTWTLTNTNMTT